MSRLAPLSRLTIVVTTVAALLVGCVFLVRFPVPVKILGVYGERLIGALGVVLASWTCGGVALGISRSVITRISGITEQSGVDSFVDKLLVGIPVYGTVVAAISWAGYSIRLAIALATLLLAVPAVLPLLAVLRHASNPLPRLRFVILVPIVIALIGAMTPVNSPDELIYKLSVPKAWLDFGAMVELPLNSNSYFPAAMYAADLGAIVIADGGAARLVHFVIFLLTLRVIWRLSDHMSPGSGSWSSAVFAWTPALLMIAGWCWAEWGMLGLLLLSWHRFQEFMEGGTSRALAVSAMALAGAVATKYTAGPWLVVFVPLAMVVMRSRHAVAWRALAACGLVVILFGGFFYARNAVWTGSPLAPFGLPDSPEVAEFRSDRGGWWEFVRGYDVFHPGMIDDSLGILLPVVVLLAPLALTSGRFRAPFFVLGVLQTIWLISLSPTSRLIVLGIAPLAILGVVALHEAIPRGRRLLQWTLGGLAATALFAQMILVMFSLSVSYEPWGVLFGSETEAQYMQRMRAFTGPYDWIERATPPESVILLLGETRAWHLDRPAHWAGNLDGPRVATWLGRAGTVDGLRAGMADLGITHILIHRERYRVVREIDPAPSMLEKEYLLVVPPETDALLQSMLARHASLRYAEGPYLVYEIKR